MRRCLALGRIALDGGDAPVGALIVSEGTILAEGIESVKANHDPTAHAEMIAVKSACGQLETLDLSGTVLYTNVEPCVMCAFAIRQTGIRAVIFGMSNNLIGGTTSKFAILSDPGFPAKFSPPEIRMNILPEECDGLWREFQERRSKLS